VMGYTVELDNVVYQQVKLNTDLPEHELYANPTQTFKAVGELIGAGPETGIYLILKVDGRKPVAVPSQYLDYA